MAPTPNSALLAAHLREDTADLLALLPAARRAAAGGPGGGEATLDGIARAAYRTLRYITDWESLCRAYRASFEVARQEPERYARMSAHASASLERFCSRKLAVERLRRFLDEAAQGAPAALQSIPA